jgi:hypothetical protein
MKMPRRFRPMLLALALPLLIGFGACSSDINTPQELAFGSYQLLLVNGDSLPVQTGELDGYLWYVLAGAIVANSNQTCEFRHTYRFISMADQSVRVESEVAPCTWQLIDQGFHVRFNENGSLLSGLLAQNALWFDFPGNDDTSFRFMYQRTGTPPNQ